MKTIFHGRAAIAWWIFGRGLIGLLLLAFLAIGVVAVAEHVRGLLALNAIRAEMKAKGEEPAAGSLFPGLSEDDRPALKKLAAEWGRQEKQWPFQWNTSLGFQGEKSRQAASLTDPLPAGRPSWKDKDRRSDPVAWADIEAALAPMRPALDLFRLQALSLSLNGRKLAYGYSGYLSSSLYAQTLSDLRGNRLDRLPDAILFSLGLKEGDAAALTWEALQHDGWTDDGLTRLAAAWSGTAPLDEIGNNLRRVCFSMADEKVWPLLLENDDLGLLLFGHMVNFAFHDIVQARTLRSIQDSLDALERIRNGEPYPSVAAWLDDRRKKEAAPRGLLGWLDGNVTEVPFFAVTWTKGIPRRQTAYDEVRVAIALARYKVKNGLYPPALAALVPQFLPAVPKNLYDGKPFSYHLWDDGTFIVEAPVPKTAGFDSPVWPRRVP